MTKLWTDAYLRSLQEVGMFGQEVHTLENGHMVVTPTQPALYLRPMDDDAPFCFSDDDGGLWTVVVTENGHAKQRLM